MLRSNTFKLQAKIPKIKGLISAAGITSVYIPHSTAIGYGQLATYTLHIIDTYPSDVITTTGAVLKIFYQSIEVFKSRLLETFNPLYWIIFILFLPQQLLQSFGVNQHTLVAKLLQLVWWILTPVTIVFRDKIYIYIIHLFQ